MRLDGPRRLNRETLQNGDQPKILELGRHCIEGISIDADARPVDPAVLDCSTTREVDRPTHGQDDVGALVELALTSGAYNRIGRVEDTGEGPVLDFDIPTENLHIGAPP